MARIESIAVAGFYATSESQLPRIASLLRLDKHEGGDHRLSVLDPCAGEGQAIETVTRHLTGQTETVETSGGCQRCKSDAASVYGYIDGKHTRVGCKDCTTVVEDEHGIERGTPREDFVVCERPRVLPEVSATIYSVEMEEGRHKVLSERKGFGYEGRRFALHGDSFCVPFKNKSGVGLLYLNPPYDLDKVHGRLEERFLLRWTEALAPGGVLVFVVPYYALSASAETFARSYEDVACYRFAGEDFDVFKQVVVFAKRLEVDRLEPDAETLALVHRWAKDGASLPEMPLGSHRRPVYLVPMHDRNEAALEDWKVQVVDAKAVLDKFKPWHETVRRGGLAPLSRVVPDLPLGECMHRTYEAATPLRPAYIASGLASGLFDGQRIEPDDPQSKLPPLLVKGVFDREWQAVEEKHNKDGEKTGEVQVQAPKLVVTVLDLDKRSYHMLRQEAAASSGVPAVADMSVGDLLARYGQALMRVMDKQCVVTYDPREEQHVARFDLVETPRKLFTAQAHAARACLTLLADRAGERSPVLIGEIGSGKSTVSIVTARSHGARRVLVFCPPHLLDSWRNEVAAVFPDAEYRVLSKTSDVDALLEIPGDRFVVAVLSRETAKLGHRLEGVSGTCPACITFPPSGAEALAKKRARCQHRTFFPGNDHAHRARKLALLFRAYGGQVPHLPYRTRDVRARQARLGVTAGDPPAFTGIPADVLAEIREALVEESKHVGNDHPTRKALVRALACDPAPGVVLSVARRLVPEHYAYDHFVESLLLLLPPGGALGQAFEIVESIPKGGYGTKSSSDWFKEKYAALSSAEDVETEEDEDENRYHAPSDVRVGAFKASRTGGRLVVGGAEAGSLKAAEKLLRAIGALATWVEGEPCGEPLYQSVPEPRRYPLAKYITKRHRSTFDFVIVDEAHEAGNGDSAQSVAAFRLANLHKPTIFMTGTIMNGYAESLFPLFSNTDKAFQEEFDRGDLGAFVDRYGYRKRLVSDKEDGEVVAFGSQSDRVERSERDLGSAPGILPLFLFRHLLRGAVTLQKADLRIDLPALSQDRVVAAASGDLLANYDTMLRALVDQIKEDRYKEGKAGKLFGQLSEFPSYLDRATVDVGNGRGDSYEVHYPESVEDGGMVTSALLFPEDTILPKEALMLDVIEREIKEGRRAMVFGWHLELLPRLQRLLQERLGEVVPVLYADKVATAKRQAWIDKNVVAKKARVLVTNPVCIQTGLNNLVHFATIWQHENPACNPVVDRQSVGRIDRIGQKLPTRVFRAFYGDTLQEKMYDLLMRKIAISTATDGLDPESAMLAAGVEQDSFVAGLSLGKALWKMIEEDGMLDERPRLRLAVSGRR